MIDALQATGRLHITDMEIAKLREFVTEHNLAKKLRQCSKRAPAWMLPIIDGILA
ncbi:MAG: hypothetical protein ACYDG3_04650 [Bacillati bacterium]